MSEATRSRVPLLLLAMALLITAGACCSIGPRARMAAAMADPDGPIAIVSMVNGQPVVVPDPIVAHDRARGTDKPVAIQWLAGAGDTLVITMKESLQSCVDPPTCEGPRCVAYTRRSAERVRKECRYNVTLNGVSVDPVVIIQPCC